MRAILALLIGTARSASADGGLIFNLEDVNDGVVNRSRCTVIAKLLMGRDQFDYF